MAEQQLMKPTYAVTVQPQAIAGDPNPPMATPEQLDAVSNAITRELAEALLGNYQEVTIRLMKAAPEQAWVSINGGEEEPPPE